MRQQGCAKAGSNVALVKYWGKRDDALNLPATGSISLTLAELTATARVVRSRDPRAPRFTREGRAVTGPAAAQMGSFLEFLSRRFAIGEPLCVDVEANFPVAAGLASSAAIFCAVTVAAAAQAGARATRTELSGIARQGSGSAARSLFGGLVEWQRGERPDGSDSTAHPLLAESEWDLAMAVAVVSEEKKEVGSRDAMRHVADTSPLYPGWIAAQPDDLRRMREAIAARDLGRVGTIAEENCLRMHATAISARPPVMYWKPATLALISEVRALRSAGTEAYFTIDAGPQVKALCHAADLEAIAARLESVPGVQRVLRAHAGPGASVLEGDCPWS